MSQNSGHVRRAKMKQINYQKRNRKRNLKKIEKKALKQHHEELKSDKELSSHIPSNDLQILSLSYNTLRTPLESWIPPLILSI